MPGEVLNGPESEVFAGFFGKLPSTGDFVSRGLPDGFRRTWDAWVTRHLAPLQREGARWPDGGLRFRLGSGGRTAGGVVVPGADSVGRLFPLSLIVIGDALPAPDGLDPWCEAALSAADGATMPDVLSETLAVLQPPAGLAADCPPMLLWARGVPPLAADPSAPAAALKALFAGFSSSGSSTPCR